MTFEEDLRRVMTAAGHELLRDAQGRAPRETGALAASLKLREEGDAIVVATGVPYAPYVEWGTRARAARPFMRPALDDVRRELPQKIRTLLRQYWGGRG